MSLKIERGQIWWVNLDPTRGREIRKQRPCVVVSSDVVNRLRSTPVVVPLSTSGTAAPPVVVAMPSAGKNSVAVVDQIRAVDKGRFLSTTGRVSTADLARVETAIREVLALPG
jgi:mRNA interferase MazF